MQDHMRKHITIDTKVTFTSPAFIPPALRRLLLFAILFVPLLFVDLAVLFRLTSFIIAAWRITKGSQTAHTLLTSLFAGARPGYCGPVAEGEKMVVRSREMGGEEQGELAGGAGDR